MADPLGIRQRGNSKEHNYDGNAFAPLVGPSVGMYSGNYGRDNGDYGDDLGQ